MVPRTNPRARPTIAVPNKKRRQKSPVNRLEIKTPKVKVSARVHPYQIQQKPIPLIPQPYFANLNIILAKDKILERLRKTSFTRVSEGREKWLDLFFEQQQMQHTHPKNTYSQVHLNELTSCSLSDKTDFIISSSMTPRVKDFCHLSQCVTLEFLNLNFEMGVEFVQRTITLPVESVKTPKLSVALVYLYTALLAMLANLAYDTMAVVGFSRRRFSCEFFRPWQFQFKSFIPDFCSGFASKESVKRWRKRPKLPAIFRHPVRSLAVLIILCYSIHLARSTDLNQHNYDAFFRNNMIYAKMGTASLNNQHITYSVKYLPCEKITYLKRMKNIVDNHRKMCEKTVKITDEMDYIDEIAGKDKKFTYLNDKMTLRQGKIACNRIGLSLVEVRTSEQRNDLSEFMDKHNINVTFANIDYDPKSKELYYGSGVVVNPYRPFETVWRIHKNHVYYYTYPGFHNKWYTTTIAKLLTSSKTKNNFAFTYILDKRPNQGTIRLCQEIADNENERGSEKEVGMPLTTNIICEAKPSGTKEQIAITDSWRTSCRENQKQLEQDYYKISKLINSVMPWNLKENVMQDSALYFGQNIFNLEQMAKQRKNKTEKREKRFVDDSIAEAFLENSNVDIHDTWNQILSEVKRDEPHMKLNLQEQLVLTEAEIKSAWKDYIKDFGIEFEELCNIAATYEENSREKYEIIPPDGRSTMDYEDLERVPRGAVGAVLKVLYKAFKMGSLVYQGTKFFNSIEFSTTKSPKDSSYRGDVERDLRNNDRSYGASDFKLPFKSKEQEFMTKAPKIFITMGLEEQNILRKFYFDYDYLYKVAKVLHHIVFDLNYKPPISAVLDKERLMKISDTVYRNVGIRLSGDPALVQPQIQTSNTSFVLLLNIPIENPRKEATIFKVEPIALWHNNTRYITKPRSEYVAFFNSEARYCILTHLEAIQCLLKKHCLTGQAIKKIPIKGLCGISHFSERFNPQNDKSCLYLRDQEHSMFARVYQDKIFISSNPLKTTVLAVNCLSKRLQKTGHDGILPISGIHSVPLPWSCRASTDDGKIEFYPQLTNPRSDPTTVDPIFLIKSGIIKHDHPSSFKRANISKLLLNQVKAADENSNKILIIMLSCTAALFFLLLAATSIAFTVYYNKIRNAKQGQSKQIDKAEIGKPTITKIIEEIDTLELKQPFVPTEPTQNKQISVSSSSSQSGRYQCRKPPLISDINLYEAIIKRDPKVKKKEDKDILLNHDTMKVNGFVDWTIKEVAWEILTDENPDTSDPILATKAKNYIDNFDRAYGEDE